MAVQTEDNVVMAVDDRVSVVFMFMEQIFTTSE
jgi:hypothetical protein